MNKPHLIHWADRAAQDIIRQKGDKESYVLAGGITPSGAVHFGNFREVITVDFVAQALRKLGKRPRFIFSWDDFDTFRKVPDNIPQQKELKKFLHKPIVDVPDPYGREQSYASFHEKSFERQLEKVSIEVEPLYQSSKYRAGEYGKNIVRALEKRKDIASILNRYRQTPYGDDYFPVSIYCSKCNTDHKIEGLSWDGQYVSYLCGHCGYRGKEDPLVSSRVKLPWRIDWPMRWAYENVDFEPGGKDHSCEGGSFSTAKDIVKLFGGQAPVYLQYDFVSIKGQGGKMSSSSGNLLTLDYLLQFYPPEVIRWIFASTRPNVDFSISLDIDVIKTYENFDRQERLAYGLEKGNEKKQLMAGRVFELSQKSSIHGIPPFRPSFRHLTNVLQIYGGDIERAKGYYKDAIKNKLDEISFVERGRCALAWLNHYAPKDFTFSVNDNPTALNCSEDVLSFLSDLRDDLSSHWERIISDKELQEKIYEHIHRYHLEPPKAFQALYQVFISRDQGPKLAEFMLILGKEKVLYFLSPFRKNMLP